MLFCSPTFLLFFLVYVVIWRITPSQWRLAVIIIGSLTFYGYWNWRFLYIPVLLTLISHISAKWIDKSPQKAIRRYRLAVCISILMIPLLFFKYFNFFAGKIIVSCGLPIGISFITFTLIAYLIDVAKKTYPLETSISWLMGYVCFFPQLIAGPILRPHELLPQLKKFNPVSAQIRSQAFIIFTVGLAKKLIMADQLKPYVDKAYLMADHGRFMDWLVAVYGFPAQIYCDFSGYSDMAIGLALFFGVHLPVNFNRPFLSASVSELWGRWHITLSYWFRDYVYIPLGGKTPSLPRRFLSKVMTMVLCGFWHGASWNFVVWGFLQGGCIGIEYLLKTCHAGRPWPRRIKVLITFHVWVVILIVFRAHDMSNAIDMLYAGFGWSTFHFSDLKNLLYPITLMVVFYITHRFDHINIIKKATTDWRPSFIATGTLILWLISITLSSGNVDSPRFIYFDF